MAFRVLALAALFLAAPQQTDNPSPYMPTALDRYRYLPEADSRPPVYQTIYHASGATIACYTIIGYNGASSAIPAISCVLLRQSTR